MGIWHIASPVLDRPTPYTFRLVPCLGTETYGRSGFLIHGDNAASDASHGCIIANRDCRRFIAEQFKRRGGLPFRLDVVR